MIISKEKKDEIIKYIQTHKQMFMLMPLPIIVIVLFVAFEVKAYNESSKSDLVNNQHSFNTELPFKENKIDELKSKNEYYNEHIKDSLDLANSEDFNMLNINSKEGVKKDSLELALEKMQNFSFEENNSKHVANNGVGGKEKISYQGRKEIQSVKIVSDSKKPIKKKIEEDEEDEDDSPIVIYSAPIEETTTYKLSKVIRAKILGTQTVTQTMNQVTIRLLEDLELGKHIIEKNTRIVGISSFSENRVFINIQNIQIGNSIIETDITVTDQNGYDGIHINGGTGAEIEESTTLDIGDDISNDDDVQKVPGSNGIIKTLLTKKVKAKLNPDYILLKNTK